mgnify:CR=1 FL=1
MHPLARKELKSLQPLALHVPPKGIAPHSIRLDLTELSIQTPYSFYPKSPNEKILGLYSSYLKAQSGVEVFTPYLFLTPGSDFALDLLLRSFTRAKDSIGFLNPGFWFYERLAKLNGVNAVPLELAGCDLNRLDVSKIPNHLKMIFIDRPNNPLGTILHLDDLKRLCLRFSGIIVVDEAYFEFSDKESALRLLHFFPNLVITRSFSKSWGLAGLRAGVIIADPSVIRAVTLLCPPFPVSQIVQDYLIRRLKKIEPVLKLREKIRSLRNAVSQELQEHGVKVYPSEGNTVLFETSDSSGFYREMLRRGYIVKEIGPSLSNAVRITLTETTELKSLIQAIREILTKGKKNVGT